MDDLISRQAALDALLELVEARRTWIRTEAAQKEISGIDASMCAIHDLPSAERRGRWIYKSELYSYCGRPFYPKICSVCNGVFEYETTYCPNCGAKMDKCEVVSETGTPPEWGDRSWAFRGGAKKAEVEENG